MKNIIKTPYSLRFDPARLTQAIDWHGHLAFAAWLIETLRPHILVELGVFRGDSFAAFAQAVREQDVDCKLFGVDTWQGDATTGTYDDVYPELKDYFDIHHPSARLMRMLFDSAISEFADGSIDLLHVDGCHEYAAVKQDYEMWKPKISDRGVILFHDIEVLADGFGVYQYWREVRDQYPSFSFKHGNGLGILLVGKDVPEELLILSRDAVECEKFKAIHEALGGRFFYRAKAKYWQTEHKNLGSRLCNAQLEIERLNDTHAPAVQMGQPSWTRRLIDKIT